jgi:hypothetical protein
MFHATGAIDSTDNNPKGARYPIAVAVTSATPVNLKQNKKPRLFNVPSRGKLRSPNCLGCCRSKHCWVDKRYLTIALAAVWAASCVAMR